MFININMAKFIDSHTELLDMLLNNEITDPITLGNPLSFLDLDTNIETHEMLLQLLLELIFKTLPENTNMDDMNMMDVQNYQPYFNKIRYYIRVTKGRKPDNVHRLFILFKNSFDSRFFQDQYKDYNYITVVNKQFKKTSNNLEDIYSVRVTSDECYYISFTKIPSINDNFHV